MIQRPLAAESSLVQTGRVAANSEQLKVNTLKLECSIYYIPNA
jgi:hypothetical protein